MIRDRGSMKWTAMMLPEHVAELRAWQKEDGLIPREQPDEQQLEEWNYLIAGAAERGSALSIDFWQGAAVIHAIGTISKIDRLRQGMDLCDTDGLPHFIPFVDIKSISEIE